MAEENNATSTASGTAGAPAAGQPQQQDATVSAGLQAIDQAGMNAGAVTLTVDEEHQPEQAEPLDAEGVTKRLLAAIEDMPAELSHEHVSELCAALIRKLEAQQHVNFVMRDLKNLFGG